VELTQIYNLFYTDRDFNVREILRISMNIINALSFDLEDWFCVSNLRLIIKQEGWHLQELRITENTMRILRLLKKYKIEATFFVLGWIAEQVPDLIREIESQGHEIAIHGYSHSMLTEMEPAAFDDDIARALAITRSLVTGNIIGYRAPTFSLTKDTLWATDILIKHGILYDSSIFPMSFVSAYDTIPGISSGLFRFENGLIEFPLSCARKLSLRIPCSGGCFFRALPYSFIKYLLEGINRKGDPFMFYLHPWEIDPDQPKQHMPFIDSIRHYINLDKTYGRLERLIQDFRFTSAKKVLGL
jgi:polysaccharide deacetylase family protein (PEP-CTERM system associated)